jgi:CBS domain-containing protein
MEEHRLYSLRARDIMNQDFVLVPPLATVQEAVEAMLKCGCQAVIVDRADEGDAYGMVTYGEIVYQLLAKSLPPSRVRVVEIMVKPLIVVTPNLRLPFIAQLFARVGIQNALVIDEHRLAGIISSSDLVKALATGKED